MTTTMKTRSNRIATRSLDVLTFYADEQTAFRRTEPVPQLACRGKPCSLFQPDVVQCRNMGGDPPNWGGSDVRFIILLVVVVVVAVAASHSCTCKGGGVDVDVA